MPQSGLIGRHHWKLVRDDLKKSLKEIDPHATRVLQIFSLKNIPWHNSGEPLDFSFFLVIVFRRMRENPNNGSLKNPPSLTTCRRVHTPSMTIYPGITLYQWSAYIFADLYTYAWKLLFSFNNTSYLFHLKILTPNFLLY